jgi:two-component system, NarL family, sensor histidine kinase UhpB
MSQLARTLRLRSEQMTIFEQVVLCNSLVILISTFAAYWVTHLIVQPYHELIVTVFVLVATVLGVAINALVLRRAFGPLFAMLTTIGAIGRGERQQRVATAPTSDLAQLSLAFNGMLDTLEEERQTRLRAVTEAQEAERRRLALELHDGTGQELTAMLLRLELLAQDLAGDSFDQAAAARQVAQMQALTDRTLRGIQQLAQHLRPTMLDDLGLMPALQWLADEMQPDGQSCIQVQVAPLPPLDALFRISQEALTNAVRHSKAQRIDLRLTHSAGKINLLVSDDGHGFDRERHTQGLGLASMHDRAELLGGTLTIQTAATGTCVAACIPFPEGDHD